MNRAYRICLISIVLLSTAGCDQVTKQAAKAGLASAGPVSLLHDIIRLEYAENPGAFLSLGEQLPRPILLFVSSLLSAGLILLLIGLSVRKRGVRRAMLVGLSLTAGGSIGNLIDRLVNGGVVIDFLNVGVGQVRSGIFNVADMAILTGAIVWLWVMGGGDSTEGRRLTATCAVAVAAQFTSLIAGPFGGPLMSSVRPPRGSQQYTERVYDYGCELGLKRIPIGELPMKATWKDAVLAESGDTVVIEGNHYFPAESLNRQYFRESSTHSLCPWKGEASYYDVVVDGEVNKDAAWYYPEPKEAAKEIKGRVAFWKGVRVG